MSHYPKLPAPPPSAPPAPPAPNSSFPLYLDLDPPSYDLTKNEKIMELINRYEIDPLFSEKLELLNDFEIVLLLDDSGSMNTPLNDNTKYDTRWDELKGLVNIVISVATIFDENGIDIFFLNRPNYENVTSLQTVSTILNDYPSGTTPLTKVLNNIFIKFRESSKPVLIVIATDGVPNNLNNFTELLKNKEDHFYISFLACSDQESDIGYLNKLDRELPNIDTLDDYISELKEIKSVQGNDFRYTFGDHIIRLLLGPICPELDNLDEKKMNNIDNKGRCIIL